MKADVREYCDTCQVCQLRRPALAKSRVLIALARRPDYPFQVVSVDLIRPRKLPASKGHHYMLVLVDQHTRWLETVCLTSLSAGSTCDTLLEIFHHTGIPEVIASVQGTNFTSAVTQELITHLG